ncbi:MAG: 16S rRNA (cytosine(1402)-N(4))-methyltransferase RsmH [Planctomycetaceae bacterium]|nr:16S rRNA (cytosine(1402)-N(4))-methyltransferase RsmH [Planctomycetaceae bacterium]
MNEEMNKNSVHIPVLLNEVLSLLNPRNGSIYIDGTMGGGGHTEKIAEKVLPDGLVISMDCDLNAVNRTEKRLRQVFINCTGKNFPIRFVHANYRFFAETLDQLNIPEIDGFLLDLGLSSDQLAEKSRGFSFDSDGTLDMRFDDSEGETAADLLFRLKEEKIADIIYEYGEEKYSRKIAKQIAERRRKEQPVKTAGELAELVRKCVPREHRHRTIGIDPATRTFQALRIAVNDELGSLKYVLENAFKRLKTGGVFAVISFHSLEDRIVKNVFRDSQRWNVITKKPITATEEEIKRNPRARSAKLRAAEKI